MYRAQPVGPDHPLYQIVERLSRRAGLPMPKVYIIPDASPNAFATGRNPDHAAVAATEGILRLLSEDELAGVVAHELAHVKHRDILISSVAATIAAAIMFTAQMAAFAAIFGGGRRDDRDGGGQPDRAARDHDPGAAGGDADPGGHLPLARVRGRRRRRGDRRRPLRPGQRAAKLEMGSKRLPLDANPATAHMFIIKPFTSAACSRCSARIRPPSSGSPLSWAAPDAFRRCYPAGHARPPRSVVRVVLALRAGVRAVAGACLGLVLLGVRLGAQVPSPSAAVPVSARDVRIGAAGRQERIGLDHIRYSGAVELELGRQGVRLSADVVDYYVDRHHLTATGNVVFVTSSARIASDRAELDTQSRTGTFVNAFGSASVSDKVDRSFFGGQDPTRSSTARPSRSSAPTAIASAKAASPPASSRRRAGR